MSFLSRLCLSALAGPSNMILNWRGKRRQPSLFLILRGKHWVKCDVSCWSLHKYPLSGWGSSLLFLICWEFLSKMNAEVCYAFSPNLLRWSRSFSSFVCGYGEFCWLIFKVQTMYSFIRLTNICGQLFCPSIVLGDGDKTLTIGMVPTVRSSSILVSLGLWGGVQGSPALDPPACTTSVLKNVPPASPFERPGQKVVRHGQPQEQGESGALGWENGGLALQLLQDETQSLPRLTLPHSSYVLSTLPALPSAPSHPAKSGGFVSLFPRTLPPPPLPDLPATTGRLVV